MNLLQRTINAPEATAMTNANPFSELGRTTVESAARAARISMDSAERAMALQMDYARGALKRATQNAHAMGQARDVQELMAMRTRMAEVAIENLVGYSRNLYEVASEAQSEYSRLAEERMARFQQAVTDGVEQATRGSPAGSEAAVAAIKSQLAATTAAFDTFTKTAKNLASYADAASASTRARSRK